MTSEPSTASRHRHSPTSKPLKPRVDSDAPVQNGAPQTRGADVMVAAGFHRQWSEEKENVPYSSKLSSQRILLGTATNYLLDFRIDITWALRLSYLSSRQRYPPAIHHGLQQMAPGSRSLSSNNYQSCSYAA